MTFIPHKKILRGPLIIGKFKISGHSMEPALKSGQIILASKIPYYFRKPKVGDIVLFEHKEKVLIKRVSRIRNNKFTLTGDNKSDTLSITPINKERIMGKVFAAV